MISMLTKNVIAFMNGFLYLSEATTTKPVNRALALQLNAELMQFGYMLREMALVRLSSCSEEEIVVIHDEVLTWLKKMTGATHSFKPFWPNFPQQVIAKTEIELWAHQLLNYWTKGAYLPNELTEARPTAFEHPKYINIGLGSEREFLQLFTDRVGGNQSLAPVDLEIIKWFVENKYPLIMPERVPFKENLATLAALYLPLPVKTVTDVLRIAVGMSGGDVSLPKVPRVSKMRHRLQIVKRDNFKFRKFKRKERKYLLGLLERTNLDVGEMWLKKERWLRLGEILHPGSFKHQFPKTFKAFNRLRNERVTTWHGEVAKAFRISVQDGIRVLSSRPGEFMRRLDWLLRTNVTLTAAILDLLKMSVGNVSNKVLYETFAHFEKRLEPDSNRSITIKGSRKKIVLPDLPPLEKGLVEFIQLTTLKALLQKFQALPPMGKVWIDPELRKLPLPLNMRSLNPALKPKPRGSRIPMQVGDAKVARVFLHFTKVHTSETIDLSAIFIGMGKWDKCDWRKHKVGEDVAVHSGDSWARYGACAEYIDIDLAKAVRAGFKYALIQLHNYNGSSNLYENNHFGIMERNFPQSNDIWLPATISDCAVVRVENTVNYAILDLETREYIIVDEDAGDGSGLNVASSSCFKNVEEYTKPPKFSVYDLLSLHATARGTMVDVLAEADQIYSFDYFSKSYVKILEYMGV